MFHLYFNSLRYISGLTCVVAASLICYSDGSSPDAFQQLSNLAILSLACLLFGMGNASKVIVIIVGIGCIAMISTSNPYAGQKIAGLAGLILAGLSFQVGIALKFEPKRLSWILYAVMSAAFLNALEGLLQWFDLVVQLHNWIVVPEQRGTAFGAFRQPNLFATFLCVGAVCTVWLQYQQRITASMGWFISTILMLGVAASGSRAGLLEVIALAGLGVLWRKHHTLSVTRLMVGQLALLGLSMLLLPKAAVLLGFNFKSGLMRIGQTGQEARLQIWSNAGDMILQRPWFGWGWREMGYGHYITLFDNRFQNLLENSHNLPLQIAIEFGLPVAFFIFSTFLLLIYQEKPWQIYVSKGLCFSGLPGKQFAWTILLLIVGIHSMIEYPLWYSLFLFLTGLFLGYVFAERINYDLISKDIINYLVMPTFAVALIGLAGWSWWQYQIRIMPIFKTPFTNNIITQRTAVIAALENARGADFFQEHIDFARLITINVTQENAVFVRQLAEKVLHYSAEPRVIQPLLLSIWYLQDYDALLFHSERFCRAFPVAFRDWTQRSPYPMVMNITSRLSEKCSMLMS